MTGELTEYRHMTVDDDQELERKRTELRELLEDYDWVVESKVDHVEEILRDQYEIRYDPGVVNKETDSKHINFAWTIHTSFMTMIKKEFDLREKRLI